MVTATPRTFGYIRCSTDKQQLSPEVQHQQIVGYIDLRQRMDALVGREGLPNWTCDYVDALEDAASGRVPLGQREQGSLLLAEARAGDHVVVAKLDRIGRDALDILTSVKQMQERGIVLHILNFGGMAEIDTSGPVGRLLLVMLAAFAELERAMIAERTKAALAALKRSGQASNHPPTGMTQKVVRRGNVVEKRFVWDSAQRAAMVIALEKHLAGWSYEKITKHLNEIDCHNRGVPFRDSHFVDHRWSLGKVKQLVKAEKKRLAGIDPVAERAKTAK